MLPQPADRVPFGLIDPKDCVEPRHGQQFLDEPARGDEQQSPTGRSKLVMGEDEFAKAACVHTGEAGEVEGHRRAAFGKKLGDCRAELEDFLFTGADLETAPELQKCERSDVPFGNLHSAPHCY